MLEGCQIFFGIGKTGRYFLFFTVQQGSFGAQIKAGVDREIFNDVRIGFNGCIVIGIIIGNVTNLKNAFTHAFHLHIYGPGLSKRLFVVFLLEVRPLQ